MSGKPDPKRPKRLKATREEWDVLARLVYEACDWRCVACGETNLAALSIHHVVGKDRQGDDVAENLVVLCGYKPVRPNGCHKTLQEKLDGWEKVAGHVRAFVLMRTSRIAYVMAKENLDWFDREYPAPPFLAVGDLDRYRYPDPDLREETSR